MSTDSLKTISEKLLEILVCPVCRTGVTRSQTAEGPGLKCSGCGRIYPVRDGIPVMLESEAVSPDRKAEK